MWISQQLRIFPNIWAMFFCRQYMIYNGIYNDPCFEGFDPWNWRLTIQKRGHLGSRYIYIYNLYRYVQSLIPQDMSVWMQGFLDSDCLQRGMQQGRLQSSWYVIRKLHLFAKGYGSLSMWLWEWMNLLIFTNYLKYGWETPFPAPIFSGEFSYQQQNIDQPRPVRFPTSMMCILFVETRLPSPINAMVVMNILPEFFFASIPFDTSAVSEIGVINIDKH